MLSIRTALLSLALLLSTHVADAARCVYISSYHTGYAWSDGVARGLLRELEGHCEITTFNMDTKRNKDEATIKETALKAKKLIEAVQPDVVIASDDNASKYLIVPYFKDADIPFVFCGVNWSVEKYGFPYKNVTGMIEVAAIDSMFEKASAIAGKIRTATYIGADTLTEQKNSARFVTASKNLGIEMDVILAKKWDDWLKAYETAQKSDVIIMGSNAGIENWDESSIIQAIHRMSKTLTMTNHGWMMPYTMFGMTKVPEEHGEWAGKIAKEILNGTSPADIPIIPNRRFNITINNTMLGIAGIEVPEFLRLKSQPYR